MGRDKNVDKKEINIFCVATFSVALVLFIASKLPVKAVVGMCIADYVFLKFMVR